MSKFDIRFYLQNAIKYNITKRLILTDKFELDIIELLKIKGRENEKDQLLDWLVFLEKLESERVTRKMEENENIKEAKKELDRMSQDDVLRRMAFKAELERMDHEQMMYEAKRDGKKEGIKEGIVKGVKEEKIQIAKNMLKKGMSISDIIEITGLTKEEIEKLV